MTVYDFRPGPEKPRRQKLLEDPNVTGDLLLIGLAMDHFSIVRDFTVKSILTATGFSATTFDMVMREDTPRYDPPERPQECGVRGPRGGKCPRSAVTWAALPDPDDGTVTWVAGCQLTTHLLWPDGERRRHAERHGPCPLPLYNTRSRLAPHFPTLRWAEWWTKRLRRGRDPYDPARDPVHGSGVIVHPSPKLRVVD